MAIAIEEVETVRIEGTRAANAREYERAPLSAEVTMESDDNFYTGFSANISEGGIFITTHDTRAIGEVVELSFTLPDGEQRRITVLGEVRWVREYNSFKPATDPGMGISFLALRQADRERIERFVARREPLFYDE